METASQRILAVNGGSSSLKFALFETGDPEEPIRDILAGGIERIGTPEARLRFREGGRQESHPMPDAADPAAAVAALLDWIGARTGGEPIAAIGHRVVHGGPEHGAPTRITPRLIGYLRGIIPFAPNHLPGEIRLIETFLARYPRLPHIACFDTAFHHDLPRVARLLSIPHRFQAQGARRYGFHGLSYAYLRDELARVAGPEAARGRVILAHLGNGASLAALRDGKPVETSMGFTPASGLVMGTRSGDLDPGLMGWLARSGGMDAEGVAAMAESESGLLGVSGTSSDMRDLMEREARDERAADAVALFCHQARKWIGAFAAALGGLDTLVFSGGIGENASEVRARICAGMGFLGLVLDGDRNAANAALVSRDDGAVAVRVIATDEARMIARSILQVLRSGAVENLEPSA